MDTGEIAVMLMGAKDAHADPGTMALILIGVLLFVAVGGALFGANSRTGWRRPESKDDFRAAGSMRPEDWPPSEFKR